MQQTPFHVYYTARNLSNLAQKEKLIPVFASSNIEVYPFQVAAANFALRSHYRKGVILCDEAGLGKTHEAMLVVVQRWIEGLNRILIAVPNVDLLVKWRETFEKYYTVPYKVLINRDEIDKQIVTESTNAFEQDAVILTTYDFLVDYQIAAKKIGWDITVFDEANLLSSVCDEKGKEAKILKEIAEPSYKILLTGTPIEKNIMDLYGLMYFIDETVLPDAETYMRRYLRRPENYPELAERVSKYCFRTLRSQAKRYAKLPERILVTLEYTPSAKERRLYDLLYNYCNKENKVAFPKMDSYEMSLKLLSLQSSSTAAILQTIKGIIKRLEHIPDSSEEIDELKQMKAIAESIKTDEKAKLLIRFLNKVFPSVRLTGAAKKAVIFTEYIETQKVLYGLLKDRYKVSVYNGSADYSALKEFKENGNILISTDIGARGFDFTEASLIINYDLLFNSLKIEQRIDRCQRLGQQNDVLAVAFIDKNNYSDVRKLELIRKRYVVSEGVFGLSDPVIGGFTDDMTAAIDIITEKTRTKKEIDYAYKDVLTEFEEENKQLVSQSETLLFTSFSEEVASKVNITPQYIKDRSEEINNDLWEVTKYFFKDKWEFYINDETRTISCYGRIPKVFTGAAMRRNEYSMAKGYQPRSGRHTLTGSLAQNIFNEIFWVGIPDRGTIYVEKGIEPCTIGYYQVKVKPKGEYWGGTYYYTLIGKTSDGRILTDEECQKIMKLPVLNFTHYGETYGERDGLTKIKPEEDLDSLIDTKEFIERTSVEMDDAQKEEILKMQNHTLDLKAGLERTVSDLRTRLQQTEQTMESSVTRFEKISLQKKLSALHKEFKTREQNLFFDNLRLEQELEEQINRLLGNAELAATVKREFIIDIRSE